MLRLRAYSAFTRSIDSAASSITIAAASIVQILSPGNNAFMIEPMTVATSSCESPQEDGGEEQHRRKRHQHE